MATSNKSESTFHLRLFRTRVRACHPLRMFAAIGISGVCAAFPFVRARAQDVEAPPAEEEIAVLPDEPVAPPDGVLPEDLPLQPVPENPVAEIANCVIDGEVSDAVSLDNLAGVIVEIAGSGRTIETDATGKFRFEGLPAGDHTLEASKLGYTGASTVITTIAGEPAVARFALQAKPADEGTSEFTLEEETVVGEYQGDNSGDFNLTIMAEAPALAAGISREEFSKNAVSDAGEAIAKVSGANIVDGKYAVVRGLADRYVTTTFNSAQIASADPSRKAVQLDLFPTNVIEGIKVDKTFSPSLSADFGGAAIDIATRAFPQERILNFKVKTDYNTSTDNTMYVHPERSLGFFGDTGKGMPDIMEGRNPQTGAPFFYPTADTTPQELKRRMEILHRSQSLLPKKDEAELGKSFSLTYGDTFQLRNGMKLGVITALAQSSGDSNNTSEINNQNRSYFKDDYERGVELSAFASAALEMNELNTIQLTYFNKHAAKDTVTHGRRIRGGSQEYGRLVNSNDTTIVRDTFGADAVYFREFWDIGTVERDLEILQLKGSHRTSERGVAFNWNITESDSAEIRPHSSHFEYGRLDFSAKALAPYVAQATARLDDLIRANAGAFGFDPQTVTWASARETLVGLLGESGVAGIEAAQGMPLVNPDIPDQLTIFPISGLIGQNDRTITAFRRADSTEESASHKQMEVKIPFHFSKTSDRRLFELGVGGSNLKKTRDVRARVYGLVTAETNGSFAFPGSLTGIGGSLAGDPSGISDYFTGNITTGPYYGYGVGDGGVENINTVLNQNAIFLSGRLQWDDYFIAGGIRQEKERYKIDVASAPLIPFPDHIVDSLGWEKRDDQRALVPSFSTGGSFFDNFVDVMFAWSRTVARPTFWEFLPTTSTDQSSGIVRRGNVALDHTTIDNFDLSATLRPSDSITVRASVFHKKLDRPLIQVFSGDGIIYKDSTASAVPGQARDYSAVINGIELEAEVAKLGPFSLKGNITYIDAVLDYYFEGGGQVSSVSSQLPFQPSWIANVALGYQYEPWKFSANLIYNFNGEYPVILKESEAQSEVTRLSLSTFDLVLAKQFERAEGLYTIRGGVKNLLGAEDTYRYDGRVYSKDTLGRTFFLEAEVSF